MPNIYTWRFVVRSYEVNQAGIVTPPTFQNYLEEMAIRASDSVGYDRAWYLANNCSWVMHRMSVAYGVPIGYNDAIEARTWVSDFHRVRSHREYELVRVADGARVLRGRADWVFVDTLTKRPKRALPEFEAAFQPDVATMEPLALRLPSNAVHESSHTQVFKRQVLPSEIDELGHVNNAHYLRWIEDACYQAYITLGLAPNYRTLSHDLEYMQEIKWGDTITVRSNIRATLDDEQAWEHTIFVDDALGGTMVASDYHIITPPAHPVLGDSA